MTINLVRDSTALLVGGAVVYNLTTQNTLRDNQFGSSKFNYTDDQDPSIND